MSTTFALTKTTTKTKTAKKYCGSSGFLKHCPTWCLCHGHPPRNDPGICTTLLSVEFRRVVLQSLESLTLNLCCTDTMISSMEWLHVPSLEHLLWSDEGDGFSKLLMDDICVSLVQLRHLTLRNMKLRRRKRVPASLWDHLSISKRSPWNLSLLLMSCSLPYPPPGVAPALHVLTSKRLTYLWTCI